MNRNQPEHHEEMAKKQAYLRTHVPEDKYEDFAQFCESYCGTVDINMWTYQYIQEIIHAFNENLAEKEKLSTKKQQKAFYLYQTGQASEIKNLSMQIKQENSHQHQTPPKKETHQYVEKPIIKQKQQKTALDVLNSVFQHEGVNNGKNSKNEYQTKKYDKSFFESSNFWEVPSIPQKVQTNKNELDNKNKFEGIKPQNFQQVFQTGTGIVVEVNNNKKQKAKQALQENEQKQIKYKQINVSELDQSVGDIKVQNREEMRKKSPIKIVSVNKIQNTSKLNKIPYEGTRVFKEAFKEDVACFKSFERAALSSPDLKVTIRDHEIVNRSFFSSDYVMYHVNVLPKNIICRRNFQDFLKLKNNLANVYPGVKLPYIERLGWLESELSLENITKQKIYLEYFMKDLLNHKELRNSRLLQDFLTLRDHKQIKRKFEEYEKIKSVTCVQELCLLEGIVKVELTEEKRIYNELIRSFNETMQENFEKQNKLFQEINQYHVLLSESYQSLSQIIKIMQDQVRLFNRKVTTYQLEDLQYSCEKVKAYCQAGCVFNRAEANILKENILPFIKYERQNMKEFDGMMLCAEELLADYISRKDEVQNVDYLNEKLKQYKTSIVSESKNIVVLKYQAGYLTNQVVKESQHYFDGLGGKISDKISSLCERKLSLLSKCLNQYTNLINL